MLKSFFSIILILVFLSNSGFVNGYSKTDVSENNYKKIIINNYKNTQTRNISYNITLIKRNFYHNNIAINNLIGKYIKKYERNINNYLEIKIDNEKGYDGMYTKPIVSLLNGFLTVESGIDNFGGKITANNFFNLVSGDLYGFINKNIFNYNLNLLSKIKEIQRKEYLNAIVHKKNISYCNIGNIIKNDSNLIYVKNGKDISLSIEKQYSGRRNKIGHKISICKIINKYLLNENYRRNLYYLINAKTSYVGAILPFQMMPNNLYYYLGIYNKNNNIDLSDITFYYDFISLFLFGENYQEEIKKYNKHFDSALKLKQCIRSIRYDPYCIFIKKQIFRYNHANWYVKKVLNQAYHYQLIDEIGIFVSPVKDAYFIVKKDYSKIEYLIKNIKTIISQKYKGLKHWGIDITVFNNLIKTYYITDKDNIELIYNILNPMKCYFIPYNKNISLSKDIGNVIFCNNDKYGILYGHIKDLAKNVKVEKKEFMSNKLVTKFVYQLVGRKTGKYKNGLKIDFYELKNIKPGMKIAYMGNTGLGSKGLHVHYSIINMKTHKFIDSNKIYDIIKNIKYFK